MDLIEHYLRHLHTLDFAPGTIQAYRCLLRDLDRFLQKHGVPEIIRCREADIIAYLRLAAERQSGPVLFNTVCRLKQFFRYLVEEDLIFYSPIETYRVPKFRSISRSVQSADEMSTLLDSLRTNDPLHIRTKAILELAWSSALRSCEIRHLRIEHVDEASGTLFIEQSKNRKDRTVPIGAPALKAVATYIHEVRPHYLGRSSETYVFISHRGGGPLSASGFWRGIDTTLSASGIAPISPHSIRASSATALLKNGMHVGFIAELLGHTELSTTQIYLRMNERTLTNEITRHHPRKHMTTEGATL